MIPNTETKQIMDAYEKSQEEKPVKIERYLQEYQKQYLLLEREIEQLKRTMESYIGAEISFVDDELIFLKQPVRCSNKTTVSDRKGNGFEVHTAMVDGVVLKYFSEYGRLENE